MENFIYCAVYDANYFDLPEKIDLKNQFCMIRTLLMKELSI